MAFIAPGGNTHLQGFRLDNQTHTSPSQQTAFNITSVRSSGAGDHFGASWDVQQSSIGTSRTAVANPWTTTDAGANLCKKWGASEPLWPWPMNDRIKAATSIAGAYAGPCLQCSGGRLTRKPTDLTAIIESLLGTIPSACKR
jgi:hypothetical protein